MVELINFYFELAACIWGNRWKLVDQEKKWIKATAKKAYDLIPTKVMDKVSTWSFPAVIGFLVARRAIPQARGWLRKKDPKKETQKKETTVDMEDQGKSYFERMKQGGG